MAVKPEEREFAAYVVELLQTVGPVRSQRMFGGFGIFLDELMFGLIVGNVLYLKADDDNRAAFVELGLGPFTYQKQGKDFSLSYFQAPEESLEDPEVMNQWGSAAYGAALRAARSKAGRKRVRNKNGTGAATGAQPRS